MKPIWHYLTCLGNFCIHDIQCTAMLHLIHFTASCSTSHLTVPQQMGANGLLLVFAASVFLTMGKETRPGTIQTIPGAIKEYKGKVFPISSFVDIKLNIQPLNDFKNELNNMSHSIQIMIDNIFKHSGPTDNFNIISPALHRLKFKMSSYTDVTYNSQNTSRVRRGLFDFVGVLSNQLFGIVDTKSLENRLQEYNGRQNTFAETINANSRALSTLSHNVQQLRDATSQFHTMITKRLNSAEVFAELAFITNQYELTFLEITSAASSFQNAVLDAAQGHVTKELISHQDIQRIIQKLRVSHNLQPLFHPSKFMLLYSCLSSYLTTDGISILLPLQPQTTLRGYLIHPFPLHLNFSEAYVTLDAPAIILAPPHTRVVTQSHAIALPTQNLYDTCHTPAAGIYVCRAPLWPYYKNTSSCAHAIVSHPHNIHGACTFSTITPTVKPFILNTQLQTVFYFYSPTPAAITCNNSITHSNLMDAFVLPHTCSLSCISFSFPAIKHYHTTITKQQQFPKPIPLPRPHTFIPPSANLTLSTVQIPPPIAPPLHHHRVFAYGYPIASSIAVIIVLIISLVLIVFCAKRCNVVQSHT